MQKMLEIPIEEDSLGFTPEVVHELKKIKKARGGTIKIGGFTYDIGSHDDISVQVSTESRRGIGHHSGYSVRHTALEVIEEYRKRGLAIMMQNIRSFMRWAIPVYESTADKWRLLFQLNRWYYPIWIAKDYGVDDEEYNVELLPLTYMRNIEPYLDKNGDYVCVMEFDPPKAMQFAERNRIEIKPDKFIKVTN